MDTVDPFVAEATGNLLAQRANPAPWRCFEAIPHLITRVVSAPVRHVARVGLLLVKSAAVADAMRMSPTRGDKIVMTVHRTAWRMIPRFASRNCIDRYMRIRLRFGSPVWRPHYAPEALVAYRTQVKDARIAGTPRPARPSANAPSSE